MANSFKAATVCCNPQGAGKGIVARSQKYRNPRNPGRAKVFGERVSETSDVELIDCQLMVSLQPDNSFPVEKTWYDIFNGRIFKVFR